MQSTYIQKISHTAPTIGLTLFKQTDQCQKNVKTHSHPHGNTEEPRSYHMLECVSIWYSISKFYNLECPMERIYKQCMLSRLYNLAEYIGTNVHSSDFPAVFSRVLFPATIEDVLRVKTEIVSFPYPIKAVFKMFFQIPGLCVR